MNSNSDIPFGINKPNNCNSVLSQRLSNNWLNMLVSERWILSYLIHNFQANSVYSFRRVQLCYTFDYRSAWYHPYKKPKRHAISAYQTHLEGQNENATYISLSLSRQQNIVKFGGSICIPSLALCPLKLFNGFSSSVSAVNSIFFSYIFYHLKKTNFKKLLNLKINFRKQ